MIDELRKRRGETDGCHIEEVYSCEYGEMLHDYDVLKAKNKALEERVAELEECLDYAINCGHEVCDPESGYECITCRSKELLKNKTKEGGKS